MDPLALEHAQSHCGTHSLECRLPELYRNGHVLHDSVFAPLHELHRRKLLSLTAEHLVVEREWRYDPLRGVLSDALDGFHNEVLHSVSAYGLPQLVLPCKELVRRR